MSACVRTRVDALAPTRAGEPMDTTPMRRAWINCTAHLCPRLGLHAYHPRCAGAMLAAWVSLWRHAPMQSNTTLAEDLYTSGAADGAAISWHQPIHAAAALAWLTHHAHDMLAANKDKDIGAIGLPRIKDHVQLCAAEQVAELNRRRRLD